MSSNIEILYNPEMPFYFTATNMILPIMTISRETIYNFVVNIGIKFEEIVRNLFSTMSVMVTVMTKAISQIYSQYISNIDVDMNQENLLTICAVICAIALIFYDKNQMYNMYYDPIANKVKELEQQILHLKKIERMRDNDWELLMQSQSQGFKQIQENNNKKFISYEKQLKKMDKELKLYQ
jgi:hypothetical protein